MNLNSLTYSQYRVYLILVMFCWQCSNRGLLPTFSIIYNSSMISWPTKDKKLIDIEYLACYYYLVCVFLRLASICCFTCLAHLAYSCCLPSQFDTSVFFVTGLSIELYKSNSWLIKKDLDFKISSLTSFDTLSALQNLSPKSLVLGIVYIDKLNMT